ncbi:MAG: DUF1836 domain-containing protein [Oscillospiraceae bacterium]|nr:DUF1836 domain-containing protein [Oscillospiraceae bacterium]
MEWNIPGTVLTAPKEEAANVENLFRSMFLAGGMVLSQVSSVTGLEPYMVQNWVKRGFLAKPQQKRYTLRQLCRIININMLKSALPMENICGLLGYINGQLDDESDDLIDDATLYFMFVRLAAQSGRADTASDRDQIISKTIEEYQEPVPGAKARVEKVLRIMLTAWASAQLQRQAETMLRELDT